jgi:hypothetical protein
MKIKSENNKILNQFKNCINNEEYDQVKREFNEIKGKNKKMEDNMEKLLR